MAKKVASKTNIMDAVNAGDAKRPTKAFMLREWFATQTGTELKWSEHQKEIEQLFNGVGHSLSEKSDELAFRNEGQKLGKVAKRESRGSKVVAKVGVTVADLKNFSALTADDDAAELTAAIQLISKMGGIEKATATSEAFKSLADALGGEEKARTAIEVLPS